MCHLIHTVLNAAIPKLRRYVVLDVSLDPVRDAPQRLYAYSVGNRYNWTFLTGPPDVLEGVTVLWGD